MGDPHTSARAIGLLRGARHRSRVDPVIQRARALASARVVTDHFVPLQHSPYAPTEFLHSVHNDAPRVEYAYREPDGLPYGMKLTVAPRGQFVNPKTTVLFRCTLELDDTIIDAGCRSDRQFRLVTWRREAQSTTRWGGVQYKVSPRKGVTVTLSGWWDYGNTVQLQGEVAPDPGGGTVRTSRTPLSGLGSSCKE